MVMMILQTFGHSLLFSYLDYHDLLQKLAVVCAGKKSFSPEIIRHSRSVKLNSWSHRD